MKVKMLVFFILFILFEIAVVLFAPESKQVIGGWVGVVSILSFWLPEIIWRKFDGH